MDNHQRSVGGFLHHWLDANPRIGHAVQNLVRGFTNEQPPPPYEPSLPEDDPDLADMPPPESARSHLTPPQESSDREMTPAEDLAHSVGTLSLNSSSTDPDPPTQDQDQTTPQGASLSSRTLPSREQSFVYESEDSMPSLQSVSDSDSDFDMHDIESRVGPEQQSQSSSPSTSAQPRSSRRARVDDEEDEEDMRETNRQRRHSPVLDQTEGPSTAPQESQRPYAPHANATQPDATPNVPPPPYSRVVYTFDFFPPNAHPHHAQADAPPGNAQAPAQEHHHHHHHHHAPMFTFTFQMPATADGAPAPGNANAFDPGMPPVMGPDFAQQFFGMGPGAPPGFFPFFPFGAPHEEEQDDPERAERLIRGLEEVSPGFVQRMEKVAGDEGEACCSVCWEKLSSEGGGFDSEEQPQSNASEGDRTAESGEAMELDNSSTPSSNDGVSSEESSSKPKTDVPRIVALPCSHVFHTSCLLPWFTKPHRTTCPSCRFDIDPESLTYMPPRQRRPRQTPQGQGPAPAPVGAQHPQPPVDTTSVPAPAATPIQPGPVGQDRQPPRPATPPMMPFELGFFIPIMGAQPMGAQPAGTGAGAAPGHAPASAQAAQDFWEGLLGGRHPPPAQTHANAPASDIPPAPQNAPGGSPTEPRPDESTMRNIFDNVFRLHPLLPGRPQMDPNSDGPAIRDFVNELFGPHHPRMGSSAAGISPVGDGAPQRPPNATNARAQGRPRPPEKRQWTLPAPPGPTLRQRVERQEREQGLRCSDISCGLGPSDEDPLPVVDPSVLRQVSIRPLDGSGKKVCEHTFHPSCLVSAERVAGWGGEDKKEEKEGEEVQVSCPVCRAVGVISRTDWDEGACALA